MTNPFAQAFAELREVIAHASVLDRREALARWRARWIDEAAASVSVTVTEELQQPDERTRAMLMASRGEAQVLSLGRVLVGRPGVLAKSEEMLPLGGGTEYRLGLCVVRAEPNP